MVIAIVEPVCAGLLVALINKYILNGNLMVWLQSSCTAEEVKAQETTDLEDSSSTSTNVSADVDVHVHH
jgi:hypothetical protein